MSLRRFWRAFVAAFFLTFLVPAEAAPQRLPPPTLQQEREAFREGFVQGNPLGAMVVREFPDEFAAFSDQLLRRYHEGSISEDEALRAGAEFMVQIVETNGRHIAHAPQAELIALGHAQHRIQVALQRTSIRACYTFAEEAGLPIEMSLDLGDSMIEPLTDFNMAMLAAIVGGRDHPTSYAPITDSELEHLISDFESRGGSRDWLLALGDPEALGHIAGQERCRNGVLFSSLVEALPPAQAARLLAWSMTQEEPVTPT